ncbi:colicin-like pore-forming protein [Proteus columbae]|uniref:colicin-like pore-forming protein n=1 Tax=Proteus columbae TaxID=1987580 RepID=UPI0028899893|nr:colicin-like pore-forming protein [Proteus columbae]
MSINIATSNSNQIPPNYGVSLGETVGNSTVVNQKYENGWVNSYDQNGYLVATARPVSISNIPDLVFDPEDLNEKLQQAMQKAIVQLKNQIAELVKQTIADAEKAELEWIESHPVEHAELVYKQLVDSVSQTKSKLTHMENELKILKDSREYKTLINPKKDHYSQPYLGVFGSKTVDIENQDDLNILLEKDGDKTLAVLIMSKEDWFSGLADVALANKVRESMNSLYKATEKARNSLINKQKQVAEKTQEINDANKEIANKENEKQIAEKRLNNLKTSINKLNNEVEKDAVKFTADFYKEIFNAYGDKAEKLAKDLASQVKGKTIRNVDDALKAYNKYKANINKRINAKDREAIVKALESIKVSEIASNLKKFSNSMLYVSRFIDAADLFNELLKAVKTDNWRPFFVKVETLVAGAGATAIVGFTFSVLFGGPIGILGYGLIIAGVGALIDDNLVEDANKLIGI